MAGWDDVRRMALALPETNERESRGNLQWQVRERLFVWERPLRKPDLEALGDRAPKGPVLGAMVADLGEKEALLAENPKLFFTTPHFNGYAAVLVLLELISVDQLSQVVVEAWMARAPTRLVRQYLGDR
ncbi:MAG: MmcQ/YjbR family DNA-binding protein [Acidimicrobiales bacterium]